MCSFLKMQLMGFLCFFSIAVSLVSFYMDIEGIKDFHEILSGKNLQITALKTTWYGMQEFYLKYLNGYIPGFAEKAE